MWFFFESFIFSVDIWQLKNSSFSAVISIWFKKKSYSFSHINCGMMLRLNLCWQESAALWNFNGFHKLWVEIGTFSNWHVQRHRALLQTVLVIFLVFTWEFWKYIFNSMPSLELLQVWKLNGIFCFGILTLCHP